MFKVKELWDQFLGSCVYAYNTAVHKSTAFTPFEFMFGRKPLLSIEFDIEDVDPEDDSPEDDDEVILALAEVLVAAKETILKAQEKTKASRCKTRL